MRHFVSIILLISTAMLCLGTCTTQAQTVSLRIDQDTFAINNGEGVEVTLYKGEHTLQFAFSTPDSCLMYSCVITRENCEYVSCVQSDSMGVIFADTEGIYTFCFTWTEDEEIAVFASVDYPIDYSVSVPADDNNMGSLAIAMLFILLLKTIILTCRQPRFKRNILLRP